MTQFSVKVQKTLFLPFFGNFWPKYWEREFSQQWDLCRKSANHKMLHFRPFLVKTNDSIFRKRPEPYFCTFLGPFCPKSRERDFSQIWDLHRKLANHNTLHFRSFLAKSNDSNLLKSPKTLFLCLFGHFFTFFWKIKNFLKNCVWGSFYPVMPSNFMQNMKKN